MEVENWLKTLSTPPSGKDVVMGSIFWGGKYLVLNSRFLFNSKNQNKFKDRNLLTIFDLKKRVSSD